MIPNPGELVSNVQQLASFPEVAIRIDEVLADGRSSSADIAAVIEPDPALSAALLRIANSAAYGSVESVEHINKAVRVVGSHEIRDLTYAMCATDTFKGVPNDMISVEDFWRHSLYCGAASQILGNSAEVCRGTSLFTAGLLHDVGQLVMFNQCPELSRQAISLSLNIDDGKSPWQAEREVFGFDHMDVGAELARVWHFPQPIYGAISLHHTPMERADCGEVPAVVHVANSIAVLAEIGSIDWNDAPKIEPRAMTSLGFDGDTLSDLIGPTRTTAEELIYLFIN